MPPSSEPFPRLAISDLLVLTLTTAFALAWLEALGPGDPAQTSPWTGLISLFEATFIGLTFFGFAVLVREMFSRGRTLRSLSPGHWWFLIAGLQTLLSLPNYVIVIWAQTWFGDGLIQWRIFDGVVAALTNAVFAGLWLAAAIYVRDWPWRTVLGLKGLEQFTWTAFRAQRTLRNMGLAWAPHAMHFFGVMGTVWICLLIAVLVAVALDLRRKERRDWLHYLAVVVIIGESIEFFRAFGPLAGRWWQAIYLYVVQ
jgi:hypothetical protein